LKEESEKRMVQLENEKNQEIEKQNILKKQIKDIKLMETDSNRGE
jgi:hypothetical protein